AVDDGLRGGAIIVETGRGHRRFDVADRLLALGDARFEILDARAARLRGAREPAGVRVGALLRLARRMLVRRSPGPFGPGSPFGRGRRWRARCAFWRALLLRRVRKAPPYGGCFRMLLVPEELLVGSRVDDRLAVADLDDLRREPLDEIPIVRHEDERAAVV